MNNTENILKKISIEVARAMREQIAHNNSVHTGKLQNEIVNSYDSHSLSVTMPLYGKFVDEGTKPHMPPVDAIRSWAESKGLNAWGVAINIKKQGTKAHPFIFKFNDVIQQYKGELKEAIGIDINFNILNVLKQWQSQ